MNSWAVAIALTGLVAGSAAGQTNDHYYRSWRWTQEVGSPRAAGLGGAFVAVPNDATAIATNPASIGSLSKTEIFGGVQSRGSGTFGNALGDNIDSRTGIGFIGGAGRVSEAWAVGAYLIEPNASRVDLQEAAPADGSINAGFIDGVVTEFGAALTWSPMEKVRLGARVVGTHLKLEGEWRRTGEDGVENLRVGTSSGQTRITGSVGALFEINDRFFVGLSAEAGASYEADRIGVYPSGGTSSLYDLRKPARFVGGFSFKPNERLLLAGQLDFVRYGQVRSALVIAQGAATQGEYELDDAVEPRAGIEYSHPLGNVSVQLRGGVHSEAPGSLKYTGSISGEQAFAGSERQLNGTAGASMVGRNLRVDVAGKFGGDRTTLTAGIGVRF